ncbi:MAG TPA: hypothetical protein DIC53_05020, partial [Synergistaceae bacterium]|nr:hypothetical protein [Synergistaceae bacterium]
MNATVQRHYKKTGTTGEFPSVVPVFQTDDTKSLVKGQASAERQNAGRKSFFSSSVLGLFSR